MLAFLLGLASTFINALVSSAGGAIGAKLVDSISAHFKSAGAQHLLEGGVPTTAPAQVEVQRILVSGLQQNPSLRDSVHTAMREALPGVDAAITNAEGIFESNPGLSDAAVRGKVNFFDFSWQRGHDPWGLSEPELDYEYGKQGTASDWLHKICPVGGERLPGLAPVKYRDGAGREAYPTVFNNYITQQGVIITKESVTATCPNGHQWRVFAD